MNLLIAETDDTEKKIKICEITANERNMCFKVIKICCIFNIF